MDRPGSGWALFLTIVVTIAIALAEISALYVGALPGAIAELGLATLLFAAFAWRPSTRFDFLLPALGLVCLVRPISLATVYPPTPRLGWYVLAGLPLLLGAILAIRLVPEPVKWFHLRTRRPLADLAIVAIGPVLGLLGYEVLRPAPFFPSLNAGDVAVLAVVMFVFAALVEELIFRGFLLGALRSAFGRSGPAIVFAALIPALLYSGCGSFAYAALIGVVGLVFGFSIGRGGSIWAVAASHGLMLTVMALAPQAMSH